jgi:hypothetical protein
MGSGDHCWGGADGVDPEFTTTGSGNAKGAQGRFMNKWIAGEVVDRTTNKKDFSLFRCPGDNGMYERVRSQAPRVLTGANRNVWAESVFKASGNSYMGDYFYVKQHNIYDDPQDLYPYRRWGAYRRPLKNFLDPQRNLLFWESRFIQALANAAEMGGFGLQYNIGMFPTNVPGWHGRYSRFEAVYVDGHVGTIQLRARGDMYRPQDFQSQNRHWKTMWRGPGWAYDNFPRPMVKHAWFSPFVGPERRLSGLW